MAPGLLRSLSSKFRSKDKAQSVNSGAPTKNGAAPLGKVDEAKVTSTTKGEDSAGKSPAKLVNGTQANDTSAKPDQQANAVSEYAAPKSTAVNGAGSSQHNNYDENAPPPKREDVESTFAEFASLIHASRRPLPTQMGDGSYLEKDEPTGFWDDMKHLGVSDLKAATHIIEDQRSGKPSDDKKMHMEEVMQLVSHLPTNSANRRELTSLFLDGLWKSLQHPPQSYMSDEWKYRSADGRNNSYIFPELGKAKTPYARSVNPVTVQPGAPPDPFLIFDSILAREEFKPHPNKVSSIFFNWASLVIHDLFQTDHVDPSISNTSSYLDLSILYGDTQEDQDQMRTFKDGKIKPDCFAEERLLAFPPSCGVMLIMLNRFHNYVVEQLVLVNEAGRFDKPVESKSLNGEALAAAWKKWDNDLFQTGRLVTCGLYINITLYDYLRTIVNLNRTNSTWTLDPRIDNRKLASDGTPRGTGNQVSAEFSLSYRWHSCIGETDEKWTEAVYRELFEGKSSSEVTMEGLMCGLAKYDHDLPKDPHLRPFAHLKRGPDGKFADGDLAHIMQGGIEQVAGAFGARNIPKALRAVTVLGILQCRSWNLCTLNEYRKFFALKPYDTFEEVNSDPYVADQLRHLYDHPDFIELYPGLAIEEYKDPMIPGVGICPTYTISRVVLSDAVSLVRGDRFYTIDYSPKHLTNWGFNEVAYDLSVNQGCVFYKLMLRALPNHFKENSIYAHYPMTIPSENAKIMKNLGRYNDYDWDQPALIPGRVFLESYGSAKKLCDDPKKFTVMWNDGLGFVMGKGGEKFCLGGDSTFHRKQREIMGQLIYRDKWHEHVKHFYEYITLRLLHENSHKIANVTQVDITRDVANLAHVHFASEMFDLPLKTKENPHGIFSEQEMWMAMCVIFTAIFFDFEPTKSFPLRMVARKLANMLGKIIELNVKTVTRTSMVSKLVDSRREHHNALADYGIHMIRRLSETGMSTYDMAFSQIMPTAVAMVPNQSQVISQILDYYLNAGKKHWPEIARLSKIDSKESDELLLRYVNEGIRLNGTFGSYRRAEVEDVFHEKQGDVHVKPGDKIFCSFVGAAHQTDIFPQPYEVRLDRPMDSYIHYGIGEHTCLGKEASMVGLTAMLRTFGKLRNLRPAQGPQGQLKKVPREHGFYIYMREDHGTYFPWPCSFKVNYDGELPPLPAAKAEH